MRFRPIIVALLLFGMFTLALITGGIQLANINKANQSISDSPFLVTYASELNETLAAANSNAGSAEDSLAESPVTLSTSTVFLDSIGGIWKTLKTIPITIYNLTAGMIFSTVFGGSAFAMVLGIIGAILTITLILSVWKLISTGESD